METSKSPPPPHQQLVFKINLRTTTTPNTHTHCCLSLPAYLNEQYEKDGRDLHPAEGTVDEEINVLSAETPELSLCLSVSLCVQCCLSLPAYLNEQYEKDSGEYLHSAESSAD